MKVELNRSQVKEIKKLLDALTMAEIHTGSSTGKIELSGGESKIEWDALHVRIEVPDVTSV